MCCALLGLVLVPRGAGAQLQAVDGLDAVRATRGAPIVRPVAAVARQSRRAGAWLPSQRVDPQLSIFLRPDEAAPDVSVALGVLDPRRGPNRARGARRGAAIGAIVGAVAGVVGFAAIMHAGDRAVDEARLPCTPETPCQEIEGPNVGRLFLPVAYVISAVTGAAAGALVGAGVGAAAAR